MLDALVLENEVKSESRFQQIIKDERGLSLVELLAVVVILAIIAGIGVIAIGGVIQNTREDAAVAEVQQAFSAAILYQSTNSEVGTTTEKSTFSLQEVQDAGLLDSGKWADAETVQFTVRQTDGKLTMDFPAAQLDAGQKSSIVQSELDQAKVSTLTRTQLFGE